MSYRVVKTFVLRSDVIVGEQTIPVFDIDAFAGFTPEFVDEHPPVDELKIEGLPRCDGAMPVKGNSMQPLLRSGDVVLYKIVPNRRGGLYFGQMYLITYDLDGEECVSIKFVHQSDIPGYYRLESENPDYEPMDIPVDKVRTMALIKASVRYFTEE